MGKKKRACPVTSRFAVGGRGVNYCTRIPATAIKENEKKNWSSSIQYACLQQYLRKTGIPYIMFVYRRVYLVD